MKKYLVFLLVFVFIVTFTAAPKTVNAIPYPNGFTPKPEVWEWHAEGVTGEEIPMYKITTTPRDWYQLRSNGLKVNGVTRICHGFDDGRYGWTGEIFRLVEDAWVKLPTTVGWVPTEEGHYMACTIAPAAGTYALFGYFDKAKAPVKEGLPDCYSIGIEPTYLGLSINGDNYPPDVVWSLFQGTFPLIPNAKTSYVIINADPPLTGDLTGVTITNINGEFSFIPNEWYYNGPEIYEGNLTIHIVFPMCYYDWKMYWGQGF